MTKTQMQERIDELNERLNDSANAYMDLQRRYNELNEKNGDIIAFEELKEQYRQLEIRYGSLNDSLEHEKKHREELKAKYQELYAECEKLKKEKSSNPDGDYIGISSESVVLLLRNMYDEELQEKTKKINKLNSVLQKSVGEDGIIMRIDNLDDKNYLYIAYNEEEINCKRKRKAGRYRDLTTFIKHKVSPQEARERMKNGEKAEDIAKEIGISRAYFFKKLKEAEEQGHEYIGWHKDDFAIEEYNI